MVRTDNIIQPPRRITETGTVLPDMGKSFGSLWIGVYNADPDSDRRGELGISVRT